MSNTRSQSTRHQQERAEMTCPDVQQHFWDYVHQTKHYVYTRTQLKRVCLYGTNCYLFNVSHKKVQFSQFTSAVNTAIGIRRQLYQNQIKKPVTKTSAVRSYFYFIHLLSPTVNDDFLMSRNVMLQVYLYCEPARRAIKALLTYLCTTVSWYMTLSDNRNERKSTVYTWPFSAPSNNVSPVQDKLLADTVFTLNTSHAQ